MFKRFLSIVLCCALCTGFLILPAAATSIDSDSINQAGTQYINYFADEYEVLDTVWTRTDVLSHVFTSVTRVAYRWTPSKFIAGDYMLFTIQANRAPNTVNVGFDSSSVYNNAVYEGSISSKNLHFYRILMPANPETIKIWCYYDTAFTGSFSIVSCFGVRNLLTVYDRAEFNYVAIEHHTEGEFIDSRYDVGTQFFPYTAPSWLSSTDELTRVDFNIRCDGDRFNSSAVGRVSLLVTTFCETLRCTVSLVGNNANVNDIKSIKCNLNTDTAWGLINDYEVGAGTLYNQSAYQIEFDLTGYDMTNYDLQIFISVDTVNLVSEGSLDTQLFGLTFRSMQYVPTILSNPWYKPITDVLHNGFDYVVQSFGGITGEIKYQTSRIQTFFNTMTSSINSYFNNLGNRILGGFDVLTSSIRELLGYSSDQKDNINSSVDQNQQQQEQVQDQGESMKDQIDEIEKAEDEMLQVPEIDPGDLELGTLIPSDGLTMMTNVMVTITNNNYVGQVLLLVASVALIGVMIL